jgi:cell division septation protein DedD
MASTTHDDGFHEIQLNGKQLVFLFMAGTVVAVVIFLLGVFVGRGVRAQVVNTEPVEEAAAPAPEIPPVAGASGTNAPATASEELTYPPRLAGGEAPKETLRAAPQPVPSDSAAPPRAAEAPIANAAPTGSPAQAPSADASVSVPTEPAGDGFSIQLAALAKRDEAEGIVRRLSGKGYSAYLMPPASGAPAVYRVRVGKFKDRREAESVSTRLQKEEQFKPWIVR